MKHWNGSRRVEFIAVVLSVLMLTSSTYNVAYAWPNPGSSLLILLRILFVSFLAPVFVFGLFSFPILLLLALFTKNSKRAIYLRRVQAAGIACLVPLCALRASDAVQQSALKKLAKRTEPLIAAIHRYEASKGRPPRFLTQLIPNFLPTFPVTGLPAYPEYEYRAYYPPRGSDMVYWLGANPTVRNLSQFWPRRKYYRGPTYYAILLLTLNQGEIVVEADTDLLPEGIAKQEFNSEQWKKDRFANDSVRLAMIHDLTQKVQLQGMTKAQVTTLLGKPEDSLQFSAHSWELSVSIPREGADIDSFFYWPTEAYPDKLGSNPVIRILNWAFMHD